MPWTWGRHLPPPPSHSPRPSRPHNPAVSPPHERPPRRSSPPRPRPARAPKDVQGSQAAALPEVTRGDLRKAGRLERWTEDPPAAVLLERAELCLITNKHELWLDQGYMKNRPQGNLGGKSRLSEQTDRCFWNTTKKKYCQPNQASRLRVNRKGLGLPPAFIFLLTAARTNMHQHRGRKAKVAAFVNYDDCI